MKNLRTGWLKIGRSGETIDGRAISPQDIKDMAASYDPAVYTALIWPEHFRYFNMGRVIECRSTQNPEGGQDLEAILAPNEYYLNANSYDQKLFTSMEILADFRKSGKPYLIGVGATDSPASTGTSEVRFSRQDAGSLVSAPVAITFTPKPTKPSFIERFIGGASEEDQDAMNIEALQALAAELKAMRDELAELRSEPAKPSEPMENQESVKVAALEKKVDELAALFAEQKKQPESGADKLAALEARFDDLAAKFAEALNTPHPGATKPPAVAGAGVEDIKALA